jgi:Zn-dependent protease
MWEERPERGYYDRPQYEIRRVSIFQEPRGVHIHPGAGGGSRFSQEEIKHLFIAYIVLVICFSLVLSTGWGGILSGINEWMFLYIGLPVSLIAVGLGFILHEVAHKFTAQRYGCWSEFRYDQRGLMWALVLSAIIGIVWAAPGATWFSGRVTKKENAIISLAGPAVNMTIAIVIIPLIIILPASYLTVYLLLSGWIIAFLAVFNLLPISPLDGSKIWKWNIGVYVLAFAVAIGILAFYYLTIYGII